MGMELCDVRRRLFPHNHTALNSTNACSKVPPQCDVWTERDKVEAAPLWLREFLERKGLKRSPECRRHQGEVLLLNAQLRLLAI